MGSDAGAVYVYLGSSTGLVSASEDKVVASDGQTLDYFGRAVAGDIDLDGDGYDDLIVGAPYEDQSGADLGAVYVYYGSASGVDSTTEAKITASDTTTSDHLGWSVAGEDFDNDGYGDVVAGAPDDVATTGAVYVYYGSATGLGDEQKLTASDGGTYDAFGWDLQRGLRALGRWPRRLRPGWRGRPYRRGVHRL